MGREKEIYPEVPSCFMSLKLQNCTMPGADTALSESVFASIESTAAASTWQCCMPLGKGHHSMAQTGEPVEQIKLPVGQSLSFVRVL